MADIPKEEQIDVVLSYCMGRLTSCHCGGDWSALSQGWTVSKAEIFEEAKRRGLNRFVALRPTSEGFWLLETEAGYVVFYLERGARCYPQEFLELEPAFLYWLDQKLRTSLLPVL